MDPGALDNHSQRGQRAVRIQSLAQQSHYGRTVSIGAQEKCGYRVGWSSASLGDWQCPDTEIETPHFMRLQGIHGHM
jgi:hypothetical protein